MDDRTTLLFGLGEFTVVDVDRVGADAVRVVVETVVREAACPECGTVSARVKDRPLRRVKDLPASGQRVELWWRRLVCLPASCPRRSFLEWTAAIPPRSRLTARLREHLARAIAGSNRAVSEVAAEHGVAWHTAHRALVVAATRWLPEPTPTAVLGIDETRARSVRWLRETTGWRRSDPWLTSFVDADPARRGLLLGLAPGRSGGCVKSWLAEQTPEFRSGVSTVVIDPSAPYASGIRAALPHAQIAVDHFHLVRLANEMVTDVRQRVAREQLGRRGTTADPAWVHRRMLLAAGNRLSPRQLRRLERVLAADDPTNEIGAAWGVINCCASCSPPATRPRSAVGSGRSTAPAPPPTWPRRHASRRRSRRGGRTSWCSCSSASPTPGPRASTASSNRSSAYRLTGPHEQDSPRPREVPRPVATRADTGVGEHPWGGWMVVHVVVGEGGHRVSGEGCADLDLVNAFLAHLSVRNFSPATRRAYAYDLLNFLRFLGSRHQLLGEVRPTDLFDYLEWQSLPRCSAGAVVVRLAERGGAAPATMNRRIAAVRGLFEYATLSGARTDTPVPAARRATGVRALQRGLLGHLGPGRPRGGGRLVRAPRRLPESLELADVAAFVADLITARDRAMALAMLLGGLRAGEVRGLRLADVDFGLRRIRVVGKGGKERVVPVEQNVLHRVDELSAQRASSGLPDRGVLRRVAWPNYRRPAE